MAVLKKIRSRWWSQGAAEAPEPAPHYEPAETPSLVEVRYDVRPLTITQLDECWRLEQRCFVDGEAYSRETFEYLLTASESVSYRAVTPNGERKLVDIEGISIGIFHHEGNWYALRNTCLHRGGPVATGRLECDTLTCPWHGFQYDVRTGRLLADPNAKLDTFPVVIVGDEIRLHIPDLAAETA